MPPRTQNISDAMAAPQYGAANSGANQNTNAQNGILTPVTNTSSAPITPAALNQNTPTPVTTPPPPITPDISGLATPTLGPTEQKAQGMSDSLTQLNDYLAGKGTYQNTLLNNAGITLDEQGNPTNPALTELTNRINQNVAAAKAIPQQTQIDYQGRLATRAGIDTVQQQALRENAIEALTLNSQASALKNNLSSSLAMIDQAVKTKFGPAEDKLKAIQANLDAIMKSPAYTAEQKTQAANQQLAVQQKLDTLATQKKNYQDAQDAVTKALSLNPNIDSGKLAALQAAGKTGDPAQVAAVISQLGLNSGTEKPVTLSPGASLVDPTTGKIIASMPALDKYQVVKGAQDAFGNVGADRIFDTTTGQFTGLGANIPQTGTPQAQNSPVSVNKSGGLDFNQYGLLANTDFKPTNQVDALAAKYLDQYIKNKSVPTASSLGRNMKPEAMAQVSSRAADLYYAATGQPLPNPNDISNAQSIINNNNKILNNLNVQENTISKNFALAVQNLDENNINQSAPVINKFLNMVQNDFFGDPATAQYLTQNGTISNEMSSLLALRNAGGTTVADKLASAGLVPVNASVAQQKAVLAIILKEAENGGDSIRQASGDLYKVTDPFLQNPNNPLRSNAIVENALRKSQASYQDAVNSIPAGRIGAVDNATGQIVTMLPSEFDSRKYTKL